MFIPCSSQESDVLFRDQRFSVFFAAGGFLDKESSGEFRRELMEQVGCTVGMKGIRPFCVWGSGESVCDKMGGFLSIKSRLGKRNVKGGRQGRKGEVFLWEVMGNLQGKREPKVPESSCQGYCRVLTGH